MIRKMCIRDSFFALFVNPAGTPAPAWAGHRSRGPFPAPEYLSYTHSSGPQWGFDGVVITDYATTHELIAHGVAENDADVGMDIDMQTSYYCCLLYTSRCV